MKRDRVTIQSLIPETDAEGVVTERWNDVVEIEGVMLSYGNERAIRDYGFTENVQYRFFYKGNHPALRVGNRLLYKELELPIVYVADYGKAQDVLLNTSGTVGKHTG